MKPFGQIIAHRGASAYAPENTLMAFKHAKMLGAQWIECDVRLTRDGEAVIFHDSRLHRTTNGSGWVRWKKYADLVQLDAGLGERIVCLKPFLNFLYANNLSLNLEIKPDLGRVSQIVNTVMCILTQHLEKYPEHDVLISSFNTKSLRMVRALNQTIPIGLLMHEWDSHWQVIADRLACFSVHCSKQSITAERILAIHDTGRQVLVYTANDRVEAEKLLHLGVDALFSDYPDLLTKDVK